ncbi:MAG: malonyl-ACP O-methyltransferase BioC [Legionellaceae bacterium]|nr:malonyl-ACP O-methyltransferase BioC [Legionellaceae bacterium]
MNLKAEICNAFNSHASEYELVAEVQHEIGDRLFERLQYLKMQPRYVLDVGCGPGIFTSRLKKQYPKAHIIGLDMAHAMLTLAGGKQSWRRKWTLVNADMTALPFASGQFDLIFSNQVIHWSSTLAAVIREFNRVLRPGGCVMFSTLGPDTFQELRHAFKAVDSYAHVNDFLDMHDIGDCLLREKFDDPVMDMDTLTAHYASLPDLLHGLKAQGVRNVHAKRNPGLMGKRAWHDFEQEMLTFRTADHKFPLTYEVLYGHAWKGMQQRTDQGIETFVSVEQLKSTLKK